MKIVIENGHIVAFAIRHGTPISDEEYSTLTELFDRMPTAPDGYEYRLRTDLTWELVELPPAPSEPTVYTQAVLERMTNAELAKILVGYGRSASMNKENMVTLILQLQGGDAK